MTARERERDSEESKGRASNLDRTEKAYVVWRHSLPLPSIPSFYVACGVWVGRRGRRIGGLRVRRGVGQPTTQHSSERDGGRRRARGGRAGRGAGSNTVVGPSLAQPKRQCGRQSGRAEAAPEKQRRGEERRGEEKPPLPPSHPPAALRSPRARTRKREEHRWKSPSRRGKREKPREQHREAPRTGHLHRPQRGDRRSPKGPPSLPLPPSLRSAHKEGEREGRSKHRKEREALR